MTMKIATLCKSPVSLKKQLFCLPPSWLDLFKRADYIGQTGIKSFTRPAVTAYEYVWAKQQLSNRNKGTIQLLLLLAHSDYFKACFPPFLPLISYQIIHTPTSAMFFCQFVTTYKLQIYFESPELLFEPSLQTDTFKHSPLCCSVPWQHWADLFFGMVDSRDRSQQREIITFDKDLKQTFQIVSPWQLFLPVFILMELHMKTDLIQGTIFTEVWLSSSLVEPGPHPACC